MGRRRGSSGDRVIARVITEDGDGDLVVERDPHRPSGRVLLQGKMEASYVDLADPSHLEFDYLRWVRIVLRVARARRVLHVGGGACALARALAADDPGGRQDVCESDAEVLALARTHMGLRRAPGLRVRHAEGRAFMATRPSARWDAVVIDAFEGALVPRSLITIEAAAALAQAAPLALVNVIDNRAGRDVTLIAAALDASFREVWALDGRSGNTVVVGTDSDLDIPLISARVAADPSPAQVDPPGLLRARIAATVPLRDEELTAPTAPFAGRAGSRPAAGSTGRGPQRRRKIAAGADLHSPLEPEPVRDQRKL